MSLIHIAFPGYVHLGTARASKTGDVARLRTKMVPLTVEVQPRTSERPVEVVPPQVAESAWIMVREPTSLRPKVKALPTWEQRRKRW